VILKKVVKRSYVFFVVESSKWALLRHQILQTHGWYPVLTLLALLDGKTPVNKLIIPYFNELTGKNTFISQ
jgi:hypothetical protein